jgi:hypothetical protein
VKVEVYNTVANLRAGKGLHSQGGAAKIKPAIEELYVIDLECSKAALTFFIECKSRLQWGSCARY